MLVNDLISRHAAAWLLWTRPARSSLVPAAFLAGLLRSRLARGGLARPVPRARRRRGGDLQRALGRALGDPALRVAYRLPEFAAATPTPDGPPVVLPPPGGDRAVAQVDRATGGRSPRSSTTPRSTTIPSCSRRSAPRRRSRWRTSACTPSREARLAELQASRERIVAAGDAERRRLERDLHDGAQQRLVAIALQLRLLQAASARTRRPPSSSSRPPATSSPSRSQELRELARGLHPAVLDHGLASALDVARRRARRSRPRCPASRRSALPEPVELAAVLRRLRGAGQRRQVRRGDRRVACACRARRRGRAIEIADDGVGGADDARGSGLRGLADRVEALDGRLRVVSPPGRRDRRERGAAVRVVIADDNLLVREGIAALLRRAGIEVAGRGGDGRRSCCATSTRTRPTSRSSTSACRPTTPTRACAPRTRSARAIPTIGIVILSQHVELGTATRVLAESPERLGYLLKDRVTDVDDFVGTLRRVAEGGSALDPQVVVAACSAARRDDGPLRDADPARARGAPARRRGPLEPGIGERLGVTERGVAEARHRRSSRSSACPRATDDNRRILAVLRLPAAGLSRAGAHRPRGAPSGTPRRRRAPWSAAPRPAGTLSGP